MAGTMKKYFSMVAMLVLVVALAAPAMGQEVDDSGGSGTPVPEEPENPGTQPGGGEEPPEQSEEPNGNGGTSDNGGEDEPVVTSQEEVQSSGSSDQPELANTGLDAGTLAVVALGLLLAGGAAAFAARRAGRQG